MKHPSLPLLALMAAAPMPALAQDILLQGIVVSASLEETEASRTGASVSLLSEEDLQASDIALADNLARLPGLSYSRSGGLGATSKLRIRGLGGEHIAVRIDGLDVADPSATQTAFDFGGLATGGLSRVEVLRGSQSALYGSEAVAGVVDIRSFRPTDQGVSGVASIETGSNSTWSGNLSSGLLTDRAELAFTVTRTITDGISSAASGTERDSFASTFATLYGAFYLTETLRIGASALSSDTVLDFDSFGAAGPEDSFETTRGNLRGGRVFAEFTTGAVEHTLSLSRTTIERRTPVQKPSDIGYYEGRQTGISYLGGADLSGQIRLAFGAERTKEELVAGAGQPGSNESDALFGEMRYAVTPELDLSLALRHDDPSDFDGRTTGRLAAAWRITDATILRGAAGTGFRLPSIYERFGGYASEDLQPETSRSYELGVERLFGEEGSLQLTLFDSTITDRIGFDANETSCGSGFGCYAQVDGDTRSRGVELSGRVAVAEGWALFGNYTYTDAKTTDQGVETRSVRVPRHDLVLGLDARLTARLTGTLTVQHVADVMDTVVTYGAPDEPLDDYTLANAALSYAVSDSADAYLRIENLFDEDYQTVRGYGQPGRSVFAGLRARF
ncbi:TonB-dependent receptor plug domain-containing protein [Cereibacter changlensis]|uniref:TonB-dependent receptor plug domain-containing protein n=1 Tax=Cereibacter changlensis TaxID=402884 RepID=UPI00403431AE